VASIFLDMVGIGGINLGFGSECVSL
jgi:hypothetical protein